MTGPNVGMCRCQVTFDDGKTRIDDEDHEHSDFEPFACADCDCEGFRPVGDGTGNGQNQAQINPDAQTGGSVGDRPHLALPADLGFAHNRIAQASEWFDQIHASIRIRDTAAGEPLAICALADVIEANWPEGIDPYDVIAVAASRTNTPTPVQRARNAARRVWGGK